MQDFLRYILLGLALSAPIGPINAAQLDKGMKNGFMNAWMIGCGAMLADAVYMLCIYFGLVRIIHMEGLHILLWGTGSIVLMYIGLETLFKLRKFSLNTPFARESTAKSFTTGFLIAISNPMNFIFWFGIYGSILAKAVMSNGRNTFVLHSLGIFMGIFLWDVTMAFLASFFQKFASRRVLQITSAVAGLSLVGFAGYFAFQVHQALF